MKFFSGWSPRLNQWVRHVFLHKELTQTRLQNSGEHTDFSRTTPYSQIWLASARQDYPVNQHRSFHVFWEYAQIFGHAASSYRETGARDSLIAFRHFSLILLIVWSQRPHLGGRPSLPCIVNADCRQKNGCKRRIPSHISHCTESLWGDGDAS